MADGYDFRNYTEQQSEIIIENNEGVEKFKRKRRTKLEMEQDKQSVS